MQNSLTPVRTVMKKVYLAPIVAAVATALVGGIILVQSTGHSAGNSASTLSQNHMSNLGQSVTTQNGHGGSDGGNNFGPPDDGGFGSGDQLLG